MSASGDVSVPDKELSIPGEDKRLDTKEDGTIHSSVVRLISFSLLPVSVRSCCSFDWSEGFV